MDPSLIVTASHPGSVCLRLSCVTDTFNSELTQQVLLVCGLFILMLTQSLRKKKVLSEQKRKDAHHCGPRLHQEEDRNVCMRLCVWSYLCYVTVGCFF